MTQNTWKVKISHPDKSKKEWLTQVLAQNRGLDTPKKLKEFLNPTFDQIIETKITEDKKAANRVIEAITKKQKIFVYSDYDADGLCATAIMWETLNDLGADVMPYVPHRLKEGYGMSISGVDTLHKLGANLIITVDNGVTAVNQIEHAKSLGIDVIITDHHVLSENPPKPYALVHTTQLCGAGVAWRFCWDIVQILDKTKEERLKDRLELAALATIADLVPLTTGNRAIVKIGLEKIGNTKRHGLKALMKSANIKGDIGTFEIGHILAPRINAMGRLEHGLDSLRLLCARNQSQADELAVLLSKTNSKRQDLTTSAVTHARGLVREEHIVGVISHESWHEGVIGLVASRLVESFHKPMIVISRGPEKSKGSARSIPGFNIVEAIRAQGEYLVDAGGHPMAAGFTIETRHIDIFTQKINAHAVSILTQELLTPIVEIECPLAIEDISQANFNQITKFEPYGVGNPLPVFITRNIVVEDVRTVGQKNDHLKLQVDGFGAIGFNMGQHSSQIRPGYKIDLVYNLTEDRYSGGFQLKIKDLEIQA